MRRHRGQQVPHDQPNRPEPHARAPLLQVQRGRVEDSASERHDGDLQHDLGRQDPHEQPVAECPGQNAPALVAALAGVALVEELHAYEGVEDHRRRDEVDVARCCWDR